MIPILLHLDYARRPERVKIWEEEKMRQSHIFSTVFKKKKRVAEHPPPGG